MCNTSLTNLHILRVCVRIYIGAAGKFANYAWEKRRKTGSADTAPVSCLSGRAWGRPAAGGRLLRTSEKNTGIGELVSSNDRKPAQADGRKTKPARLTQTLPRQGADCCIEIWGHAMRASLHGRYAYAALAPFLRTMERMTNRVPRTSATPMARQTIAFCTKPAMM